MDSSFYAGLIFTKKYFQVSIYISDSGNTKVFDQDIGNIWRQEGRQSRAEMNIFNAQGKQCQKNDNGLLFIPGDIVNNRQLVDIIQAKNFFQLECDQRQRIGVVALTCV